MHHNESVKMVSPADTLYLRKCNFLIYILKQTTIQQMPKKLFPRFIAHLNLFLKSYLNQYLLSLSNRSRRSNEKRKVFLKKRIFLIFRVQVINRHPTNIMQDIVSRTML